MGEQYLGINGLFGNILNMLSLVELGIGSTITYWLYKPMAENDEYRLNVLMSVYAKVYNTIGIIILLIGVALAPLFRVLYERNTRHHISYNIDLYFICGKYVGVIFFCV